MVNYQLLVLTDQYHEQITNEQGILSQSTLKNVVTLSNDDHCYGQVGGVFTPSLPLIASDLSVTQVDVQLLVTLFLVGFGLSQLFYGPMSDAVGRRPIFLLGQGIYLIGTIVCFAFSDIEYDRLRSWSLQGLGALRCSGEVSLGPVMMVLSSLRQSHFTTASIMPIIAPVFGGWISFHLGWQAVFLFVLLYLLKIFTATLCCPRRYLMERVVLASARVKLRAFRLTAQVISSASYNWMSYMASLVSLSLPYL